jgi:hypothetical protein
MHWWQQWSDNWHIEASMLAISAFDDIRGNVVMTKEKLAERVQRGIEELQHLIREHHPEAEFQVLPRSYGRRQVVVNVYANIEDQIDLSDIIAEHRADLVDDTKTAFVFVLYPYEKRPSLKHEKSA